MVISCNDRPTSIGSDLLVDTVHIALLTSEDTTLIQTEATVRYPLPIFNAGYLYVGASRSTVAWTLLRPTLFPQLKDTITEDQILSATLVLFPRRYAFGDTVSNTLQFSIYEVQRLWRPSTTIDTLREFLRSGDFLGSMVAQWSDPIPFADSLEPIRIPVAKSLIARWLAAAADTADSAQLQPFGVALIPDTTVSTVIRAFYTQSPGHTEFPLSYYEVVIQRADSLDTLRIENGYDLAVVYARTAVPEDRIVVQGGVAYRAYFVFDPTVLPPLAIVHRAKLVLSYDSTACELGNTTDFPDLVAYLAADTALGAIGDRFPLSEAQVDRDSLAVVFPNVGAALELWRSKRQRSAIVLTLGDEQGRIDRVAFYKTGVGRTPYLEVVYSAMPREKRK